MKRYLSICSGIEAATVAWHGLGWQPAGFSEVEAFPSAVLAHHYPSVPNFGDMRTFKEWNIGAIDILVGGTPCQSFSVAGLRRGLADERGNLSLTFCELADHVDPEWIVWENVPGVLSSKDNAFGCFLAGLVGADEPITPAGKWQRAGVVSGPKRTAAWRVLDAQYFGVAQRRRRVFVLAVRGSGNWRCAAALFPVGESVFGDTPPSREPWKDFTHNLAPCLTSSGRGVERPGETRGQDPVVAVPRSLAFGGNNQSGPIDVATARNACASASGRMDFETETFIVQPPAMAFQTSGYGASVDEHVASTMQASYDRLSNQVYGVLQPIPLLEVGKRAGPAADDPRAGAGVGKPGGPMFTLQAGAQHGVIAFNARQDPDAWEERTGPLDTDGSTLAVAFAVHENQRAELTLNDTAGAIKCAGGKPGQGYPAAMVGMAVRRLTPRECERLQGFPDDYTLIPTERRNWHRERDEMRAYFERTGQSFTDDELDRLAADGPRYKALGNSMAVPVMRWIGKRIAFVSRHY